jgi:hypothetical protein
MATLSDFITLKINDPDADFWIVRRGSADKVGTPVKTFSPEAYGITVKDKSRLSPDYLFYVIMYIHSTHHFERMATGSLRLQNIKAHDILSIAVQDGEKK